MNTLFTPWRYEYIKTKGRSEECFLCTAAVELDEPERLVVFATAHHLVMLNRHPYTNGHLMVAPLLHQASPQEEEPAAQAQLWPLILLAQQVLAEDLSPDGFNLGVNLGEAAGAGLPGHFHFHVVPRWNGDTNFMGVVAGLRMVPQALEESWHRLRQRFSGFVDDPRFAPRPTPADGGEAGRGHG